MGALVEAASLVGRRAASAGDFYRVVRVVALFTGLPLFAAASDGWVPARWPGGPLEIERRTRAGNLPPDTALREAIAGSYDPATLDLFAGSPINCLLVTWSAGAAEAVEARHWRLVGTYTTEAHRRGISVLGVVYPGADPAKFVPAAVEFHLDGLVLDGEFPASFAGKLPFPVIPISKDPATLRASPTAFAAVEGESPSSRSLAEMGIRAGPSSQPWISSNIWLVRSFRFGGAWRPVWVAYPSNPGDPGEKPNYARSIADAAVAGGRWIVTLDDELRKKLWRHETGALSTWKQIGDLVRFFEDHREWRGFVPYGNLGVVVDTKALGDLTDEYLKLLTRRQVPYRLIARSQLNERPPDALRALLVAGLAHLTESEKRLLTAFAASGGLVVAGPDLSIEQGHIEIYPDPDPEVIARDMRDMLSLQEAGLIAFNVPSVITYPSRDPGSARILVQLLNYSDSPARDITIRIGGQFKAARLFTLDAASADIPTRCTEGQTEFTIPSLAIWGGVLLQGETP